jgi:hypothetical protein
MRIDEFMAQAAVSFGLIEHAGEFAAEEGWGAVGQSNTVQLQFTVQDRTLSGESIDSANEMAYSYEQTAV